MTKHVARVSAAIFGDQLYRPYGHLNYVQKYDESKIHDNLKIEFCKKANMKS